MATPTEPPTITEWLTALAPYIGVLVSIPFSFWVGILKSNHDLKLDSQRDLRQERKERIRLWRHETYRHMGSDPSKGNSPTFNREGFARSETYMSLQDHLSENLQAKVQAVHVKYLSAKDAFSGDTLQITDYAPPIDDIEVKDEVLRQINELEKEWGLI